jgi:hypothetical protein
VVRELIFEIIFWLKKRENPILVEIIYGRTNR